MRNTIWIALLFPFFATAETVIKTDFPDGSQSVTPEEIRKRFVGYSFTIKPASGAEMRLQYKDEYAYINVGQRSDSGKWRTEGSAVCHEWRNFPQGCSEVRMVGNTILIKRTTNGEIVELSPN